MIFCGTAVYINPPPMVMVWGATSLIFCIAAWKRLSVAAPPAAAIMAPKNTASGPLPLDLVEHLVVVYPQRAAIKDRYFGGFFLADKCRNLSVQRIDGQMAVAPRRPIAHGWRNEEEFHAFS